MLGSGSSSSVKVFALVRICSESVSKVHFFFIKKALFSQNELVCIHTKNAVLCEILSACTF